MDRHMKKIQDDFSNLDFPEASKFFEKNIYEEFQKINYEEESNLQDLTSLFCFSIDGKSTKDRDDIISFEKNLGEDTYSIGIHISNVASFITNNSLIDLEAYKRSSSVYSLDKNIPMLPPYFTKKFGSLDPSELRKCLTVLVKLDNKANILDSNIVVSKVKNDLALNYEDIDLILNQKEHKLFSLFRELYSVCFSLNKNRIETGAIVVDNADMEIDLLDNGEIDIRVHNKITSSKLIVSEIMILYNKILAEFCYKSKLPIIYRAQEKSKLDDLSIEGLSNRVRRYIIFNKMKPVVFSTNPSPHYSMGLDRYIQATSPLRRYFDLVLQRQIINYKFYGKVIYTLADLKLIIDESYLKLKVIAKFEREREKFWVLRYFDQLLDNLIQTKKTSDEYFVGVVLESNLNGLALLELEEIPFRFKSYIPEVCFQGDRLYFTIKNVDFVNRSVNFIFRNKI